MSISESRPPAADSLGHKFAAAAIAATAAVSGGVYVLASRELRFELADGAYKNTLISQFATEHGVLGARLLRPFQARGVLLLVLFVLCCVGTAVAVQRAIGPRRDRAVLWTLGITAAIVPTLLLATLLWPDGRGYLGSAQMLAATVAVALVAGAMAWRRERSATSAGVVPDVEPIVLHARDPGRGWGWVLVALLVPLAIATWWNGIDAIRGFDSLADHLPRAARWLRLSRLSDESGELLTPYYPGNFQVLVRWVLVLGTDAYAFLPSFLASLLALAALYGICREIGQPRWTAFVSTATAASCSLIPYLATTVEADIAMTAFLLLAVLLLLRWLRSIRPPPSGDVVPSYDSASLVGLGASLGLAIGTKYSAIPPALVIGGVAAFFAWRAAHGVMENGARYVNVRTLVVILSTIAIPVALGGGYWLLRNAILHGNPLYPVSTVGLAGVDLQYIIPIKPALESSVWNRVTYPWVQWDFISVYDDGLGAAFAAVALVGFVVIPFRRSSPGSRRRVVWFITAAAYVLWIGTGSITARFGLFPLMLTFVFVGELWREFESLALKLVTVAAVAITVGVMTRSLVAGAVYTTLMPPGLRGVPAIVDSMPPTRIFNATSAANRYPLLGHDYRHEVITMFRPARTDDVRATRARYVLLSAAQVPAFTAASSMSLVARGPALSGGDTLSLWRVSGPDSAGAPSR